MGVVVKCLRCGKEFEVYPSELKRGIKRKFCSRECRYKSPLSHEILFTAYWDLELSSVQIANMFGCSSTHILDYLKKYGIPIRSHSEATRVSVSKYGPVMRINPNLTPSKELSYLLGILLGDGYVDKRNNRITLCVTSKVFANEFWTTLKSIGLNPVKDEINPKDSQYKRKKLYRVYARSKIFVEWYKKLNLKIIESDFLTTKEFQKEFIRGFYESEGSLYRDKRYKNCWTLSITNTDKKLIELINRLITNLGFKTSLSSSRYRKKEVFYLRILGGTKEVRRFIKTINPVIKNKFT